MKEYLISFRFLRSSNPMQARVFGGNQNMAYNNLKSQYPGEDVIITGCREI